MAAALGPDRDSYARCNARCFANSYTDSDTECDRYADHYARAYSHSDANLDAIANCFTYGDSRNDTDSDPGGAGPQSFDPDASSDR